LEPTIAKTLSKPGPKSVGHETLKERILASLMQKLEADGYVSLTVDEIVTYLGISKKTLYEVFTSREEIFSALVERMTQKAAQHIKSIVTSDLGFIPKMQDLLGFVSYMSRKIDSGMMRDLQKQMPHIWKRIEDFRREKLTENFTRLLRQGMKEHFIRPDLDLTLFLRIHLAVIDAIARPHGLATENRSPQETIQAVIGILFAGILTDAGRKEFGQLQSHSLRKP
jgi:AcrR family transcriptional regulator